MSGADIDLPKLLKNDAEERVETHLVEQRLSPVVLEQSLDAKAIIDAA